MTEIKMSRKPSRVIRKMMCSQLFLFRNWSLTLPIKKKNILTSKGKFCYN